MYVTKCNIISKICNLLRRSDDKKKVCLLNKIKADVLQNNLIFQLFTNACGTCSDSTFIFWYVFASIPLSFSHFMLLGPSCSHAYSCYECWSVLTPHCGEPFKPNGTGVSIVAAGPDQRCGVSYLLEACLDINFAFIRPGEQRMTMDKKVLLEMLWI